MRRRETEALKDLLLGTPDSWQLDLDKPLEDSDCGLIPPQSILENLSTLGKTEKKRTMSPRSLNRMCSRSDSLDFPSIPDLPPVARASASSGAISDNIGSKYSSHVVSEAHCSSRFSDGVPQTVVKEKIVRFIDQPIAEEDEDVRFEQLNGTMLSSSSTIRPDGFANASYGSVSDARSRPAHDGDRDRAGELDERNSSGRVSRDVKARDGQNRDWQNRARYDSDRERQRQDRTRYDSDKDRQSYDADRNRTHDGDESDRDGYGTHNTRNPDGVDRRHECDRDGYGAHHGRYPGDPDRQRGRYGTHDDGDLNQYDPRHDKHDASDAHHDRLLDGYEREQNRHRHGRDREKRSDHHYRCGNDTNSNSPRDNGRSPLCDRDQFPSRPLDRRHARDVDKREERDRYAVSPTCNRGDARYPRRDQQYSQRAQDGDRSPLRGRDGFSLQALDRRQTHDGEWEEARTHPRDRYSLSPPHTRGDAHIRGNHKLSHGKYEYDRSPCRHRDDVSPRATDRRHTREESRNEGRETYGDAQDVRCVDGLYPTRGGRDSHHEGDADDQYGAYAEMEHHRDSTNQNSDWDADRHRYPLHPSRDKSPLPHCTRDVKRYLCEADNDRRSDRNANGYVRGATRTNRDDDPRRDTLLPLSKNRSASPIPRHDRLRRGTGYPAGVELDYDDADSDSNARKRSVSPMNARDYQYPVENSSDRAADHRRPNTEISSYREVDGCHIYSQNNFYIDGDEPKIPPASVPSQGTTSTKDILRRGERSRTVAELKPHATHEHVAKEIARTRSLSARNLKGNGAKGAVNYMEGWLLKRGPRHGMDWRLRFCRLEDHMFTYYQSEDWKTKKGEIDLNAYRVVRPFRHPQCSAEARALYKKHRWGFEIFKSDEDRIYLFDASTEEKLLLWLKVLGQVIHRNSGGVVELSGAHHQAHETPRGGNSALPHQPVASQVPLENYTSGHVSPVPAPAQNELRPPTTGTSGALVEVMNSAQHWNTSMGLQDPDPRETFSSTGGALLHGRSVTAPHLRPPSTPHLQQPHTNAQHQLNAASYNAHHAPSLPSSALHVAPPAHAYVPQPQSHGVATHGSESVHQVKTVHVSYNPGSLQAQIMAPPSSYNVRPQYDAPPGYGGPEIPGVGPPYVGGSGHHDPAAYGAYYPPAISYSLPQTSNHAMSSPHMEYPSNWGNGGL